MVKSRAKRMATLGIIRMEFFQKDGENYYIHTGFARFVESLSPYFKRIDVCVPVVPVGFFPFRGSKFHIKNVRVIELPNLHGLWNCHRNSLRGMKVLCKYIREWDIVNIRIPESFSIFAYVVSRYYRKSRFIHVVGDGEELRNLAIRRKSGLAKVLICFYNKVMNMAERHMISKNLTVVNGFKIYKKYKKESKYLYKFITSSIWEREIQEKSQEVFKEPYQIIYVGRFSIVKGLLDLFHIVKRVTQLGYKVHLRIVGYPGEVGILDKIQEVSNELGISKIITVVGYKEIGEPLWNEYRKSHIFVLPSFSEATPRVLLEAMAHCLPVITTDVGSVDDVVINGVNGFMVKCGDYNQSVNAIRCLIEDEDLRRRFTVAGLKTAKENVLEKSAYHLVNILKNHFNYPTSEIQAKTNKTDYYVR